MYVVSSKLIVEYHHKKKVKTTISNRINTAELNLFVH
jgi:hypothetical protein